MSEELKPHQIAQLVNKLRDIATKYHAHGCLRELISCEVNAALTQRPAAQTEREALRWTVSVEPVAVSGEPDAHCLRASIGNQAFHIGPDYMDTKQEAEFFAEMFLHAIEVGHRTSLPAPQQATPEPLGEPFGYFRALPFGWEQCGEHDDGAVALYTRPAPGVPEGFVMVPVEPTQAMLDALHSSAYLPGCYRAMLAAAQAKGGQ